MDRGSVKRYRNKPRKSLIEVACFFLIGNLRTIINEKNEKYKLFMMMNKKKQTTKQKKRKLER